jgi:hypothetical protein
VDQGRRGGEEKIRGTRGRKKERKEGRKEGKPTI